MNDDLRDKLEQLLGTLKRNRAGVPPEELETKYKKGYLRLCQKISSTASQYVSQTVFSGLRIRESLFPEAEALAKQAYLESGTRSRLSAAIFKHCDMAELDSLLTELRTLMMAALESLYARHTGLFLSNRCLGFDGQQAKPLVYNDASRHVFDGKDWIPIEEFLESHTEDGPCR